jgi:hypothetical protein
MASVRGLVASPRHTTDRWCDMTDQERSDPELSMGEPDPELLTDPGPPAEASQAAEAGPAAGGEPEAEAEPSAAGGVAPTATPDPSRPPRASQGETPLYKGEPLDSERGPGLGCFWVQAILLGILLILTPVTVVLAWPPLVSAALLIITLILLLFTGQTVIFLLRLVAADKRSRRTPRSTSARKTVGMLEDEAATAPAADTPAPGSDVPTEPNGQG